MQRGQRLNVSLEDKEEEKSRKSKRKAIIKKKTFSSETVEARGSGVSFRVLENQTMQTNKNTYQIKCLHPAECIL
jgi:hypothetical protein